MDMKIMLINTIHGQVLAQGMDIKMISIYAIPGQVLAQGMDYGNGLLNVILRSPTIVTIVRLK